MNIEIDLLNYIYVATIYKLHRFITFFKVK